MADGLDTQATGSPDINPAALMSLLSGQQSGGMAGTSAPGGVLPPTSPVQPPAQGMSMPQTPTDTDPIRAGLAQAIQAIGTHNQRISQIEQQISQVPSAPSGYAPNFQPITGQGFGGDLKNLVGNIGKGALAAGAGTRLGSAIEAGIQRPAQARRAQELQGLNAQLGAEQEGLKASGEEVSGLGLAGRLGIQQQNADTNVKKADTAATRTDAYVSSIKNQHENMVNSWNFKQAAQNETARHHIVDEAQKAADEAGRDYRADNKNATTEDVAAIVTGTKQQVANLAVAKDPSVKSWLFGALGIDEPQLPDAASPEMRTPGAPSSSAPSAPPKPSSTKTAPSKVIRYDAQGNRVSK